MSQRRLVFSGFGHPAEVLELESHVAVPVPGKNQVVVESLCVSINPADLNYIEGVYGKRPELPAVPGMEGVVRVTDANGHESWTEGQLAIATKFIGMWQDRFAVDAEALVAVPEGIALEQMAMLKVNPPTALLMLREFVDLQPGEWIVQNAANSAVGQCVIQLARARGIRTLNLVRRDECVEPLKALGADVVLLDDDSALERATEFTGEAKPRLALNAVGGDSAMRLMRLSAPGCVHVTYGAMSRRSVKVPNRFLIFDDMQFRGFWVSRWMEHAPLKELQAVFTELAEAMKNGSLDLPVDKVYPVEEFRDAITHAQQDKRAGKVLMRFF